MCNLSAFYSIWNIKFAADFYALNNIWQGIFLCLEVFRGAIVQSILKVGLLLFFLLGMSYEGSRCFGVITLTEVFVFLLENNQSFIVTDTGLLYCEQDSYKTLWFDTYRLSKSEIQ